MSDSNNILWAVRVKYLDYHGNWHQKQTGWYSNSTGAWEEAECIEKQHGYLELSEGIMHKYKTK